MNEQLQELFIQWLPTAVPELKGASREQVITTVNELMKSEEGAATVSKLMQAMLQQIEKTPEFKQEGGTFDRNAFRENKNKTVTTGRATFDGTDVEYKMNLGQSSLGRKYAKALATKGFDESNFDFTRKFDGKEYRDRRREGRRMGMDRFQRNAYALSELNRGTSLNSASSKMPEFNAPQVGNGRSIDVSTHDVRSSEIPFKSWTPKTINEERRADLNRMTGKGPLREFENTETPAQEALRKTDPAYFSTGLTYGQRSGYATPVPPTPLASSAAPQQSTAKKPGFWASLKRNFITALQNSRL